jgi:hypothetical protein
LVEARILVSKAGKVRLLKPDELPADWDPVTDTRLTVWEMVHQLIRVLEAGGEGAAAALVGQARHPCRNGPRTLLPALHAVRAQEARGEAMAYNGLVQSWPEITRLAARRNGPKRPSRRPAICLNRNKPPWPLPTTSVSARHWNSSRAGLGPFVEREIKSAIRPILCQWPKVKGFVDDPNLANKNINEWDAAALLKLMWETWNEVFRRTWAFPSAVWCRRSELLAQQVGAPGPFSSDDAYRALDSAARLLVAVSAPQADEVEKMKTELLRVRFDEQARGEKRKSSPARPSKAASRAAQALARSGDAAQDVASGRYQQAEFAADLWQVHLARARTSTGTRSSSSGAPT